LFSNIYGFKKGGEKFLPKYDLFHVAKSTQIIVLDVSEGSGAIQSEMGVINDLW
jgi:hypothetical protein